MADTGSDSTTSSKAFDGSTSFEEYYAKACSPGPEQILPGVVMIAVDGDGKTIDKNVLGTSSNPSVPLNYDSTMWIASCTKLLTAICALQLVERGLITLDTDVTAPNLLPEWKDHDILLDLDPESGDPITSKASEDGLDRKITLKMLLTHSAGMSYDFLNPKIARWWKWRAEKHNDPQVGKGEILHDREHPLVYAPGQGWEYSVAIDWIGVLVQRLTGLRLGEYMKQNIYDKVDGGMSSTVFRLNDDPSVEERLVPMMQRNTEGKLESAGVMGGIRVPNPIDDLGGGGLFTSANDYIKVLTSLLTNDERLLKKETVKMAMQPQLEVGGAAHKMLTAKLDPATYGGSMMVGGLPFVPTEATPENIEEYRTAWNFSLLGLTHVKGMQGIFSPGMIMWGGLPNLAWWIDPIAADGKGNCGFLAMQFLPPGDQRALEMALRWRMELFERAKRN